MTLHEPLANWNGVEMPLSAVRVSVLDRSFLFGDAVYEVLRVYNGRPFLYQQHVNRLQANLDSLRIPANAAVIGERALATLGHSGIAEGQIYLQVTRGEAPRTHHFPHPPSRPNELIYVKAGGDPYASLRNTGTKVLLVDDLRWKRCDLKSVNLLANCLAAEAAHAAGCTEAVFVEEDGQLIEGSHSSLFAVRGGALLTAPLGSNILPGITRSLVLKLAAETRIPVVEEPLHRNSLASVDELFLTGTSTEVLSVVQANEQQIGAGTPGPVARALQQAYRNAVQAECG
ncbi:aminotransferase class IV [Planctomicrobium sp. SH664]|uniref:aminotransferase class IV n=1 Tax=Planctomicrobium sp. SH664 TaxID=3448125 RepID=UPI003F5BF427